MYLCVAIDMNLGAFLSKLLHIKVSARPAKTRALQNCNKILATDRNTRQLSPECLRNAWKVCAWFWKKLSYLFCWFPAWLLLTPAGLPSRILVWTRSANCSSLSSASTLRTASAAEYRSSEVLRRLRLCRRQDKVLTCLTIALKRICCHIYFGISMQTLFSFNLLTHVANLYIVKLCVYAKPFRRFTAARLSAAFKRWLV